MRLLTLLLLVASFTAAGKERRVTLVFQGDNGGEVAPCG
jgi:hypothetical protein